MRPRAAINEISSTEQTVSRRCEANRVEGGLQSREAAVDVADGEIATVKVAIEAKDLRADFVASGDHRADAGSSMTSEGSKCSFSGV